MSIKGYKVFNPDWTCRGFQYEVGKTYKHEGDIGLCNAGFHFCQNIADCFNYYDFNSNNKVAEVEAVGLVETEDDKSVTDEIKIVREISWIEMLTMANEGKDCTGLRNTGNWNTGNRNTGSCNTGNCNTGNCNTGNWNRTNFSTGFFNTETQPVYAFNKQLDISRDEFCSCKGICVLNWNYEDHWWIYANNMTDDEKKAHPEFETTGGYLKSVDFTTACQMMWDNLDDDDKQAVREIPNFDATVFEEITGIRV